MGYPHADKIQNNLQSLKIQEKTLRNIYCYLPPSIAEVRNTLTFTSLSTVCVLTILCLCFINLHPLLIWHSILMSWNHWDI